MWRREGLRTELLGDPPFCVLIEEKYTKQIYTKLLEQCCVMESKGRQHFKKEEVSALPDAEKPRKMTEST